MKEEETVYSQRVVDHALAVILQDHLFYLVDGLLRERHVEAAELE